MVWRTIGVAHMKTALFCVNDWLKFCAFFLIDFDFGESFPIIMNRICYIHVFFKSLRVTWIFRLLLFYNLLICLSSYGYIMLVFHFSKMTRSSYNGFSFLMSLRLWSLALFSHSRLFRLLILSGIIRYPPPFAMSSILHVTHVLALVVSIATPAIQLPSL